LAVTEKKKHFEMLHGVDVAEDKFPDLSRDSTVGHRLPSICPHRFDIPLEILGWIGSGKPNPVLGWKIRRNKLSLVELFSP
jgi:hypothetical protein